MCQTLNIEMLKADLQIWSKRRSRIGNKCTVGYPQSTPPKRQLKGWSWEGYEANIL